MLSVSTEAAVKHYAPCINLPDPMHNLPCIARVDPARCRATQQRHMMSRN